MYYIRKPKINWREKFKILGLAVLYIMFNWGWIEFSYKLFNRHETIMYIFAFCGQIVFAATMVGFENTVKETTTREVRERYRYYDK